MGRGSGGEGAGGVGGVEGARGVGRGGCMMWEGRGSGKVVR